ncbi:MAG: hypothetical protein CR971_01215 [candidate division SR1 bacterium]|nr:MAG: hypothetical protein CR971_01215 [candidate division SR1 bacterium]
MKIEKKYNIILAGGGTGGHVFPIQSLIEYIDKNPNYAKKCKNIYRVGTKNSLEQERCEHLQTSCKNIETLHFKSILSGKFRRERGFVPLLKNIRDMIQFGLGVIQAMGFLLTHKIDIIFCKGGYAALPIVIAGKIFGKKILVHESDTKPGLVNKIAAKCARKVFTGFDNVLAGAETVGQILSDNLYSDGKTPKDFVKKLAIHQQGNKIKTNLLLIGGSQGAKTLYEAVISANPGPEYNIFVILGKENQALRTLFQQKLPHVKLFDFVSQQEMGTLLYHTDIAITRAGTTSLAEQKLYGIKSIIVAIPWTHDQSTNAKYYVNKYQDISLNQKSSNFVEEMAKLLEHYKDFKKEVDSVDIVSNITSAKEKILVSFFEG